METVGVGVRVQVIKVTRALLDLLEVVLREQLLGEPHGARRLRLRRAHVQAAREHLTDPLLNLDGQRRGNRRLWRRLARAPEAAAGRPVGRSLPWER